MTEAKMLELMGLAKSGCSCESYYNYRCSLCCAVGRMEPELWRELVEAGFVQHGGYAPYELTLAGALLYFERTKESAIQYHEPPPDSNGWKRQTVARMLIDGKPWEPYR